MRILIVDDDAMLAHMLVDQIQRWGTDHKAISAASAEAARKAAVEAESPFDAFLIDQRLEASDVDGITLMTKLLMASPESDAIIFTGYDDQDAGLKAFNAGAYHYLVKPFDQRELKALLTRLAKYRDAKREGDWHRILAAFAKDVQGEHTVKGVGTTVVAYGPKLGFQRGHLWLLSNDSTEWIGLQQYGYAGLENFAGLRVPVTGLRYPYLALTRGETTFFRGPEHGPGYLQDHFEAKGFRSPEGEWVEILLRAGEKCIGVLALDNDQQIRNLLPEQKELLRLFGEQVAAALARVQLQEKRESEAREWKIISETGRAVMTRAACGNLDELLEEVHAQIGKLMDASSFIVALVDPDTTSRLDFRLNFDRGERFPRLWRDCSSGLVGYLIQHNTSLWFPDGKELNFRQQEGIPDCGTPSQCWLGVPLCVEEGREPIGALVVQHYENPHTYTEWEKRLLEAIARQITGAIDLVGRREREAMLLRRANFLGEIRKRLPDLAEENESDFWRLLLKYVTDECGLGFNRATIYLSEGEGLPLRGRLGVGQLNAADARREWERLVAERKTAPKAECNVTRFLDHLRTRQPVDQTPIEQRASAWAISVADEPLRRIQKAATPLLIPQDQLSLPEEYRAGFQEDSSIECAVAPLIAKGHFFGLLLADNAFSGEPVRPEILDSLSEILNYAARLWEQGEARRRAMTSAQREHLASLQDQAVREVQREGLRAGLQAVCQEARALLKLDSAVIYPLAEDNVTYQIDQIAHTGLEASRATKSFSIRPRQHGMNAHVKRVGRVVVPDVSKSDLSFGDQKLEQHGFIRDHGIRSFIAVALRSRSTDDALGVMYLNYRKTQRFSQQQEDIAAELADIATLAISTARGSEEMTQHHRTQEVNRLRYILEAALSPDADDTKALNALLANTAALLPKADFIELLVSDRVEGQPGSDARWLVTRSYHGESPVQDAQALSDHKIAWQVVTEKKPISIPDTSQLRITYNRDGSDHKILSVLAAPIYQNRRIASVLQVTSVVENAFTERDGARLMELATTAGLVLGGLRRQSGLMAAILQAAKSITQPSDLPTTLAAIVEQALKAVPDLASAGNPDSVALWYRDPVSQQILKYTADRSRVMAQPGDPVTHIMGSTEGAFWWPPDSPTTEFLSRSQFVIREEFKAVAAFPLRVAEKTDPIAALFFNYRQPHEFTAEERRALPILAAIAAANMKDAQLIDAAKRGEDAAKRSEKRLQVAVEVAKAAGAYWERDKVLPAILVALRDHFAQYLAHATPYLLLYNDDDKVLELPEEARSFYPTQEGSTQPVRLSLDAPRIVSKVARRCLEEKRAVVENRDVTKETDYEPPDTETQSELCAGLWRDGNLLGVLVLKSRQSDAFTEEDEKLFELVAEQAAAALERANQVAEKRVSDYLTGAMAWASDIAHDINVDISYIRYRTYWLRERDLGITEQGKAWAREIDARAGELADKARDESSARAGILVDFGGSLEKKVRDWQARSCPNTRINYDWGETALPVEVYFELVWKAVRHLLRNAAEAMAYKGQIWLRLRPIGVDQVELQVENNGADIPPDVRQKIFRELVSTKQGGMGLLLAKKLIEKMGGGIRLLPSQPNCGPVFAIRLPRVQKPQEV